MISIRYFSPAPALRPYISSYYWFESNGPHFVDMMRAELPQIRLVTKGAALNRYATGAVRVASGAYLQGPTTGPVSFVAAGPLHLFGIGLLPLGWAALVGAGADRLADDLTELAGVLGAGASDLAQQLLAASDAMARVAAADNFFTTVLARAPVVPVWFTRLADDWLTASPDPDVGSLIAASGMSARSVERLTKRIYGASPKLLARKYRALQAAVRIGNGEASGWRDLDGDGYYDQAHFIREFKQFVGMTPSLFARDAAPVMRLTIARKQMLPDMPRLALYS